MHYNTPPPYVNSCTYYSDPQAESFQQLPPFAFEVCLFSLNEIAGEGPEIHSVNAFVIHLYDIIA